MMTAIHDENSPILTHSNAVNRVPLVGSGVVGIFGSAAPVHQELSILVELRHTLPAISIADEEGPVRKPRNVCGPVEQFSFIAAFLAFCAEGHHEFTVVGELVNDMEL